MRYFVEFLLIFLCVINFVLGIYVFIKRAHAPYARSFCLMCIGITSWVVSNYLFRKPSFDLIVSYTFDIIANIGALLLLTGLYFFSKKFLQYSFKKNSYSFIDQLVISLSVIFIILCTIPGFIDKGVFINEYNVKSLSVGPLKPLYFVYLLFLLALIVINLFVTYKKQTGLLQTQLRIFLLSVVLSALGGFLFNVFIPILGNNYNYADLGPAFTVMLSIGSVYAMVNYRYADFRVIFSLIIEKSLIVALFLLSIYVINKIGNIFFTEDLGLYTVITYGGFILLFTYAYNKLNKRTQQRYLFAPNFNYFIDKFDSQSLEVSKPSELTQLFITSITEVIKVKKITPIVFYDASTKQDRKLIGNLKRLFDTNDTNILIYDEEKKKYYDRSVNNSLTLDILDEIYNTYGYTVVLHLSYMNNTLGYILLSNKVNDQALSRYEIDYLLQLLELYSTYLYKLELYEDKVHLSEILQKKINEATKALRKQKAELQDKYQFEKDMMGIMGHELRTPMTVAKGMSELVLNKIKNNSLDMEYADDKIQKIYASIIKEAELIQTMLSTSHIDNKKMNLQLSDVNLIDVVDYAVTAFHGGAKGKGLTLIFNKPEKEIPHIVSDPSRVQEIINNLVSNAVKYTNKGGVTVDIQLTEKDITVHVTDTGIGVPESELKNLGKKFYRVHQHLDAKKDVVRAGGTGLGLYVVKGLLVALGGRLDVVSEDNKGSTFSAVFPLKNSFKDDVFITQKPVDEHDMFEKMGFKKQNKDL